MIYRSSWFSHAFILLLLVQNLSTSCFLFAGVFLQRSGLPVQVGGLARGLHKWKSLTENLKKANLKPAISIVNRPCSFPTCPSVMLCRLLLCPVHHHPLPPPPSGPPRCIVSYETPQLEAFSLCILQKHNCRGLSAEAPTRPGETPGKQNIPN